MPQALNPPAPSWRFDLNVTAVALLALLAWDAAGLDLASARIFATAQGFPWRDHWLTSGLAHQGGRVLGWALLIALVVNIWRPWIAGPTKAERIRIVLLTLACVILVPAIKQVSPTSCPWDLVEFGGVAQHLSHWRFGLADGGPGRCFPSGHATAAFGFLSGYVVLRRCRPALARGWLAGVLVMGALFGLAQLMRGAHYPSHTLWSGWACWVICVLGAPRARLGPSA
jgi:membrane-associated PAP2 superfamily phosphatase